MIVKIVSPGGTFSIQMLSYNNQFYRKEMVA
jgi:hypothetical protein